MHAIKLPSWKIKEICEESDLITNIDRRWV